MPFPSQFISSRGSSPLTSLSSLEDVEDEEVPVVRPSRRAADNDDLQVAEVRTIDLISGSLVLNHLIATLRLTAFDWTESCTAPEKNEGSKRANFTTG